MEFEEAASGRAPAALQSDWEHAGLPRRSPSMLTAVSESRSGCDCAAAAEATTTLDTMSNGRRYDAEASTPAAPGGLLTLGVVQHGGKESLLDPGLDVAVCQLPSAAAGAATTEARSMSPDIDHSTDNKEPLGHCELVFEAWHGDGEPSGDAASLQLLEGVMVDDSDLDDVAAAAAEGPVADGSQRAGVSDRDGVAAAELRKQVEATAAAEEAAAREAAAQRVRRKRLHEELCGSIMQVNHGHIQAHPFLQCMRMISQAQICAESNKCMFIALRMNRRHP